MKYQSKASASKAAKKLYGPSWKDTHYVTKVEFNLFEIREVGSAPKELNHSSIKLSFK